MKLTSAAVVSHAPTVSRFEDPRGAALRFVALLRGRGFVGRATQVVLAVGLGQAAMLSAALVIANLVGVEDFGRFNILNTTLTTAAMFCQLSLGLAVNRLTSQSRITDPARAGAVIGLALSATLAMAVAVAVPASALAGPLALALFGDASLAEGLWMAAVALPFAAVAMVHGGMFVGLGAALEQLRIALPLAVATVALPAAGAWAGGWAGALGGIAAVHALRVAANHLALRPVLRAHGIRPSLSAWRAAARPVLAFAGPMFVAGLMSAAVLWSVNVFLVRTAGPSEMGLFGAAYMIRTILTFVPLQVAGVLLAHLSQGAGPGAEWTVLKGILAITLAVALVALGAWLVPGPLLSLFGEGFARGADVLRLMLIVAVIETACTNLYQLLLAQGGAWRALAFVTLPKEIVLVAGAIAFVPRYGGEGLAVAMGAGQLAALLGIVILVRPWTFARPKLREA